MMEFFCIVLWLLHCQHLLCGHLPDYGFDRNHPIVVRGLGRSIETAVRVDDLRCALIIGLNSNHAKYDLCHGEVRSLSRMQFNKETPTSALTDCSLDRRTKSLPLFL
jgi:hypothetical protein